MTEFFDETAVIPEATKHGMKMREPLKVALERPPSRTQPPVPDLQAQRALEQDMISNYLGEADSTVMYRGLRQRISAE